MIETSLIYIHETAEREILFCLFYLASLVRIFVVGLILVGVFFLLAVVCFRNTGSGVLCLFRPYLHIRCCS